jgi:hypothetical protein
MDTTQNTDGGETQQKASGLQSKIDAMEAKAKNLSGQAKQKIMAEVDKLKQEKDVLLNKMKDWGEAKGEEIKDEADDLL